MARAITPPSLFGIDRRIAYANRKYHSGWICTVIAHGLCSSGLFCLSNISYERFGRRSLLVNRGLINLMPRMAIWWFLLRACNMAAPPSLNLLGEIGLLSRLVS